MTRRSTLSPAKRELLERRLHGALVMPADSRAIPRREAQQVPLSFAQERMWFLNQWQPGDPAYNRPVALRFVGVLDPTALARSLSEILQRHEVLCATFSSIEGRPVQTIAPPEPLSLPVVDLSSLPQPKRVPEARRLATREAQRPFDLVQGPLFRATLLHLDASDHVLVMVLHHIAFDAWSASVFLRELAAIYAAFSARQPSPLPELPIQYADFAAWQTDWLQGEMLETQLAYWTEQLRRPLPVLNLATDRPKPATPSNRGAFQTLVLQPTLVRRLHALSRQENVTLFMVLLAAFQVLLHRYTGARDIVVGSPIAGRTRPGTGALIGIFMNTLVLRTDLSGQPSFRQLLARAREVALGTYEHQDLPIERLVEALKPERNLGQTPLFQVPLNLENMPGEEPQIQGLQLEQFGFDGGIVPLDLSLEMVETAEGLSCLWKYRTDLFEGTTIARMASHFQVPLQSTVDDPDQPIWQLSLLTK